MKNSSKDVWKQKNLEPLHKLKLVKNIKVTQSITQNGKIVKKAEWNENDLVKITKDMISSEYCGYTKYYTDGSKMAGGVGYAIFDQSNDVIINGKLNDNFNIMSAELVAIHSAINMAFKNDDKYSVILTDSQSSCLGLRSVKVLKENHLVQKIHKLVGSPPDKQIIVQWVPSHVNLYGNEKADYGAKQAVDADSTELIKLCNDDLRNLAKRNFEAEWQNIYESMSSYKGTFHFKVAPRTNSKPWFAGLELEAREIRVLTRLRTDHGMCKYRRFIYKLEVSNECEICDEIENLDHIMIDCKKFQAERNKYDFIVKCKHLHELLSDINNYKKIVIFSEKINPDI